MAESNTSSKIVAYLNPRRSALLRKKWLKAAVRAKRCGVGSCQATVGGWCRGVLTGGFGPKNTILRRGNSCACAQMASAKAVTRFAAVANVSTSSCPPLLLLLLLLLPLLLLLLLLSLLLLLLLIVVLAKDSAAEAVAAGDAVDVAGSVLRRRRKGAT